MKTDLNYIKSNVLYQKAKSVADTYVLTIERKPTIERMDALIKALEHHLNDIKGKLRRVEAQV